MKTLVDFCLMTGRRVSRWVNRLLRRLAHKDQLRITFSIGVPLLARIKLAYIIVLDAAAEKMA